MTHTRTELEERLLIEARSRGQGRVLRRVLGLLVFAFVIAAYGASKPDQMLLGFIVAGLLIVMAGVVAIRGDR